MTLFGIETFPGTFIHQKVDSLPVHTDSERWMTAVLTDFAANSDPATTFRLATHQMRYDWSWWKALLRRAGTPAITNGGFVPGGGEIISRMDPKGPKLTYRFEGDPGPGGLPVTHLYDGMVAAYGWGHSAELPLIGPDWSHYRWQGFPWIGWDRTVIVVDALDAIAWEFLACYGTQVPDLSVSSYSGREGQPWPQHIVGPRSCAHLALLDLISSDAPLTSGRDGKTVQPMGTGAGWVSHAADCLRVEEVRDVIEGRSEGIDHYLHWTGWTSTNGEFIWPSRGTDRKNRKLFGGPPHGAWARLTAGYRTDNLPPQTKVIAEGLKKHGMILLDSGGYGINTEASPVPKSKTDWTAWQPDALKALHAIPLDAFEFVDTTGLADGRGPADITSPDYWRVS